MHTEYIIIRGRITPEQLHGGLLSLVVNLTECNLKRSLYFLDVLNFLQSGADTSMHTENLVVSTFIVYDGSQWQILKHVVELLEDGVGVVNVLAKAASTLLS